MWDHRVLSTVVIKVQLVSQSKKRDSTGPTREQFSRRGRGGAGRLGRGPPAQCTPLPGQQPYKIPMVTLLYFKKN